MSAFTTSMLARLRARGLTDSPLFAALERISDGTSSPQEAEPPAAPTVTPPAPALRQEVPNPARLVPSITSRAEFDTPAPVLRLPQIADLTETLTACLDDAPCRESARRIFRALFLLALEVSRYQGHNTEHLTRAVFHLPAELLMAHLGLKKSAFYDNLGYLKRLGLVAFDAHMGDLRGEKVATGTLWAVSLTPGRVLSGHANPMRLLHDDWRREWRNLNRDVRQGRTVFNMLNPKPAPTQGKEDAGESLDSLEIEVTIKDLKDWVIHPLRPSTPDTLTVRHALSDALGAVWALETAALTPRQKRGEVVDELARALAAAMGDGPDSLNFWRWLIWQLVRSSDMGAALFDDVGVILAQVVRDIQTDISIFGSSTTKNAAACAVAALKRAGLYDLLRGIPPIRAGVKPAAA